MAGTNPLGFNDLFDFSADGEIRRAIQLVRELRAAYTEFNNVVVNGSSEAHARQQKELTDQMKALAEATRQVNITTQAGQKSLQDNLKIIEQLRAENERLRVAKKGLGDTEKAVAGSVNALTLQLKAQIKEYRALDLASNPAKQKELAAAIGATRKQITDLMNATKATTATFRAAKGSYDELDQKTKQLVRDLKQMEGGMASTSKEAKRMRAEIAANTTQLKKFDAEMNQNFRNVGNYKSAFAGLNNGLGAFGLGMVSLAGILTGLNAISKEAAQFEAMAAGIGAVTDSQAELADQISFLNTLANKYGQSVTDLAGSYKGLLASSKGTAIEGAETKRIFEGVVQAGTALKLNSEQVTGALNAIQQMMSKGKVQAEELRGQLGERLPGAFKLFAQAAGVSEIQLNKMLENGEVLAADILPKFADVLERTYSDKAIANAQGLVNETNRLESAWTRFTVSFANSTGLNEGFSALKRGLSSSLDAVTRWLSNPSIRTFKGMFNGENMRLNIQDQNRESAFQDFQTNDRAGRNEAIESIRGNIQAQNAIINNPKNVTAKAYNQAVNIRFDYIKQLQKYEAKHLQILKQEEFNEKRSQEQKDELAKQAADKNKKKEKTAEQIEAERLRKLEAARRAQLEVIKANEALQLAEAELAFSKSPKKLQDQIDFEQAKLRITGTSFDQQIGLYKRDEVEYDELLAKKKGLQADYNNTVGKLIEDDAEKQRKAAEDAKKKWEEVQKAKEGAEGARSDYTGSLIEGGIKKAAATGQISAEEGGRLLHMGRAAIIEDEIAAKERQISGFKEGEKEYYDATKELYALRKQLLDENNAYELEQAEKVNEKKKALQQAVLDFVTTSAGAAFDIGRDYNARALEDLQVRKDRELETVGNNEVAKKKINERYAAENLKLRRKQAMYDKAQALFDIAINTAVAVTAALKNPATAPFMVPLIIATGAAQAVGVLAKKLPAYAKGRGRTGVKEAALVNEKGGELIEDSRGRMRVTAGGRAAVTILAPDEKVHTHEASKHIIENITKREDVVKFAHSLTDGRRAVEQHAERNLKEIASAILGSRVTEGGMQRAFSSAISKMPVNNFTFDEYGFNRYQSKLRQRIADTQERNKLGGNG